MMRRNYVVFAMKPLSHPAESGIEQAVGQACRWDGRDRGLLLQRRVLGRVVVRIW